MIFLICFEQLKLLYKFVRVMVK